MHICSTFFAVLFIRFLAKSMILYFSFIKLLATLSTQKGIVAEKRQICTLFLH